MDGDGEMCCYVLQCVAMCYSVLLLCRFVLQCVAMWSYGCCVSMDDGCMIDKLPKIG